jgi:acyl-coenzyme A synthetase/AMP-(fatty) acid ligase
MLGLCSRFGRTVVFSTIADFRRELEAIGGGHTILLPGDAADLCEAFSGQARPAAKCGVHVDGGALGPGLRRKLLETFAYRVRNNYSMNETNYVAMVDEDNIGTVLSDAAVRIIGDDGHEKPMGETGRITVRTARMTRGYLWDEALTAKHFVDGWHITGDLGFQPEANQLVVVGRADDMLNIGGIKLPPQPIEAEIRTFDGVRDAVLLGVENAHGLLELHVVVERSDPGQDADLERLIRPLIHRYSRGFVGHYQDSLPRTQTGKVRRAALIAMIEAQSD